jgi:hypothetical protein
MILHVDFSDGSNPWVCFSDNRREIAEHWREWMKYHGDTARPRHTTGIIFAKLRAIAPAFLCINKASISTQQNTISASALPSPILKRKEAGKREKASFRIGSHRLFPDWRYLRTR